MMNWSFLASFAVIVVAALGYYPARRARTRVRTLLWLASMCLVAVSPSLVPLARAPLRLGASLIAIAVLVKLYDMHREPELAGGLSFWSYVAYLPNGFWLVLRKEPRRIPVARDLRHLAIAAPAAALSILLVAGLWQQDWSAVPFFIEHVLKVASVILAVVLTGNGLAMAYRLLGGRAIDPMANPIVARTPADFWRRWNRLAQQFLSEYAFLPAGGYRRATRATLITFGVSGLIHEYVFGIAAGGIQGCQLLFFMLQGLAVAVTMRVRPSARIVPIWMTGTLFFELSTSVLFFRSVDAVLPFYWPRGF